MAHENSVGCILGAAVGDAIGLPYEGLSRTRGGRLLGTPDRHRFLFGRGMVSDDTEMICMVAQALIVSGGDVGQFRKALARRFRYWVLSLPAGIGWATLRATVRLWLGFSSTRSGVFSAGNGPAIRAVILGAALEDRSTLRELVRASSRLTHTDPKAELGALAIALAAKLAGARVTVSPEEFVIQLKLFLGGEGDEFISLITAAAIAAKNGHNTSAFASSLKLNNRVRGYVYDCVPVVIHAWLTNQGDYRRAVMSVIECGGDTDSMAAMVGGIVGSGAGKSAIPAEWLDGICEWPRSVPWMEKLGTQLDRCMKTGTKGHPLQLSPAILPRNVFFLLIVLYHGFRRLFPPY